MNFTRINIILSSVITELSLLLSACSSTTFVHRWNDPEFKGPQLKKILVIGIIKDDGKRRAFEQEFSSLLNAPNRTGIASYTLLPNLKESGSKEDVLGAVRKSGADGVMVVTLLGVSKQQVDVAPSVDYYPTSYGYSMYGYYGASYDRVYRPGYTKTNTTVSLNVKMFNVVNEKLIWSGQTESFNPSSSSEITRELETLVIRGMKKSGIVK
ncbi:hypothetical protein MNBD_GAMMA21-2169 [hydrothermal vent metagenome]|uniref:DUF4136 domain-containing protein n=1 Tax=hydrothermal vent metagenome TaxID=652676 RepID=A0A3B0ZVY6_9ZZZZ